MSSIFLFSFFILLKVFLLREIRVEETEFCFVELFPISKHGVMAGSNVRWERRDKFPHGVGESATDVSHPG